MKYLARKFLSRPVIQTVVEHLDARLLWIMNVGPCADPRTSGEIPALKEHGLLKFAGVNVFDVGANTGAYALEVSRIVNSDASIWCFEPAKRTFSDLQVRVGAISSVKCFNFGFGAKNGQAILHTDESASGLASLYSRRLGNVGLEFDGTETVNLRTVDSFCAEQGIDRIHILKLDIEGHELAALEGAQNMIRSGAVNAIQFEFGGCNIDSRSHLRDFFDFFGDTFSIYRILASGLRELKKYSELDERFLSTNFLALRKIHGQD